MAENIDDETEAAGRAADEKPAYATPFEAFRQWTRRRMLGREGEAVERRTAGVVPAPALRIAKRQAVFSALVVGSTSFVLLSRVGGKLAEGPRPWIVPLVAGGMFLVIAFLRIKAAQR